MFCDLQGSTALSQQLDPEELREVIRSYQEVCAGAVSRFDGHIAKYLGDGLLVYFGYPQAHEDDPQRAVRAGLAIVEDIDGLNTRLREEKALELAVRIGVHTGLVVAGEMGGGDTVETLAIVGETPNISARLQEAAEPNSVVISDVTRDLIQGFFLCEALGSHDLKGISQPMALFRVVSESGAQTRFEVAAAFQLTPLVGREQEVGLLLDRWEQVTEGLGQVVFLSGEAGIGKSRLVQTLNERLAGEPHILRQLRCSPYHQNSALHPVIEFLERWLQFRREDSPGERLSKLERAMEGYDFLSSEAVPILADLLSVPLDGRYPTLDLSPERQKQKTVELLLAMLLETAREQPVLFVTEDLHWADPSALDFLGLLVDQAPTCQLLAMFTFRPEFSPPWGSRAHQTQITLNRLPRRLATDMVGRLASGKAIPEEVLAQVAAKSDGVPLFVEELTRMVLESGLLTEVEGAYQLTGPLPPLAIPSTLQDSLTARLDRLAATREVAQMGSVLGREFSYELIQAVSTLDEPTLGSHLDQLVKAEFLYQRCLPPEAAYTFKHALIQDAAYESLLRSRRQQYHQQVARVLEEQFAETVETQPELLGHHYTEAGLTEQAVPYWQRAGDRSVARSAHIEGIGHFEKGLEVLNTLPDTPERASHEIMLQRALGASLFATKGYAAPEVEPPYARARALCEQIGDTRQIFPVLFGLWAFHHVRMELQTARELAEQLLALAEGENDPALFLQGHRTLADVLYRLGEFVPALSHVEQGIALYDREQHRGQALLYGQDPGQGLLVYAGLVLWMLGYPDQSLRRAEEAVTLAEGLSHPFSLGHALSVGSTVYEFRKEWDVVQERAERLFALASEQGFEDLSRNGSRRQRLALAIQGPSREEGIAKLHQDFDSQRGPGWLRNGLHLALLYGTVGQADEGLRLLAGAPAYIDKTGERFYEAELYRIKGELLLIQGENELDAESCFSQALDVARSQKAKSWELRTATSLARLWQKQGKKTDARSLLAENYGWFTEGFDTADLKDAKALLQELA
ncbi:MAG: hypothetical protein BZY88_09425 [SAR202 cluster bacterium Io17-Chloro-G9]|nr:MAG: hypothetical protein BZY88_09425 [SAR202 cluster bacterium Io17-Chloro-G9]